MSLRSYKTKNATGLVLFNQDNFEFSKPILLGFHEKLPFLSQKNVIFHLICSWESCLWAFFGLSFDSTCFFFQTNTDLLYKSFCHVQRVFMHVIPYYMLLGESGFAISFLRGRPISIFSRTLSLNTYRYFKGNETLIINIIFLADECLLNEYLFNLFSSALFF